MCQHSALLVVTSLILFHVESAPIRDTLYDELDYEVLDALNLEARDILTDEEMDRLIDKVKESLDQNEGVGRRSQYNSNEYQAPQSKQKLFVPNCKRWQIC